MRQEYKSILVMGGERAEEFGHSKTLPSVKCFLPIHGGKKEREKPSSYSFSFWLFVCYTNWKEETDWIDEPLD